MEAVLWQVLAGTRGGTNRARLLRAIEERPRNMNQLAADLDLDYKTVQHHMDVLEENDVSRSTDQPYGAVWLPTERTKENWETVENILAKLKGGDRVTMTAHQVSIIEEFGGYLSGRNGRNGMSRGGHR